MINQTVLCAYIHENERRAHIGSFNFSLKLKKLSGSNALGYLLKLYNVGK
ncbi:hypothetical protein PA7559_14910 [Pseudoalteromonas distincta]